MSRNQREGRYAGYHDGQHVHAHAPHTQVWQGDKVVATYPVPGAGVAWGVQYNRLTKGGYYDQLRGNDD